MLHQHYFCWRQQYWGHTKHSVSEQSLPLWCCCSRTPEGASRSLGVRYYYPKMHRIIWRKYTIQKPEGARVNTSLMLRISLLWQLSTYFNILPHLKQTGYRLCGRMLIGNSGICLTQVKIGNGSFSSSTCAFLTVTKMESKESKEKFNFISRIAKSQSLPINYH